MTLIQLLPLFVICSALIYCLADFKHQFLPKLHRDKAFQHFTFFVLFGLFLLWSAQASVKEGLNIHFLGLTCFTLVYGWRTAFVLTIPVALAMVLTDNLAFENLANFLLLSSLLPILTSYAIYYFSYRYLNRNIFIYIFVAGFFSGGATSSIHLISNTLFQLWQGDHQWQAIRDNYFIFLPLLAFPEGLLNGMGAAILSVYKPEWLRTFSDKHYLYDHLRK